MLKNRPKFAFKHGGFLQRQSLCYMNTVIIIFTIIEITMQRIQSLFKCRGTWSVSRSLVRCLSGISPQRIELVVSNCNPHITNTLSEDFVVRCPNEDTAIPEKNFYNHVFQPFGKATALIDGVTGREYSYNEVQESVVNMASGLVRSGMEKGDVLALVSPNSAEFCTTFFSTLAMGGIVSTCNPQYTAEELAYQFKNSNSKYVATIPALLPTIKEAVSKSGCVEKIIVLSDEGGLGEGNNMISYQSLVKDTGSLFPHDLHTNAKEDVALLAYSSSATGVPRAVMLTHHSITASVCQLAYPQFIDYSDPNCHSIGILPFYDVHGLSVVLSSGLYQGSTNIILPQLEPKLFLKTVQKYRITCASLVPRLVVFLAKHPMVDQYDLSSLKTILNDTDSSVRGELLEVIQKRLEVKVVRQSYGMAELSSVSHCCPYDVLNPYSVGTPVLNTISKVVDLKTGKTLGPNCEGEVVIKGPQVSMNIFSCHCSHRLIIFLYV